MNKVLCFLVLMAVAFLSLGGCASIVSDSDYPVSISSQPDQADFTIKNRDGVTIFSGKTPSTVSLKAGAGFFKGENYVVSFKKDGCTPYIAEIKRDLDGWYVGNILFGGLIGWLIVDPATGAMWKLNNLHVDMETTGTASIENNLNIVMLQDVPANFLGKMERIN
jgi:hypothetical protein